jgi:NAD-dependent SIR2 family protein deacetylase
MANSEIQAFVQSHRRLFLLTQNVDRLHQAAGSRDVIDLHGRLDFVWSARPNAGAPIFKTNLSG